MAAQAPTPAATAAPVATAAQYIPPEGPSSAKKTKKEAEVNKNELLIPANGDCLFTSIFIGHLLPVINDFVQFKERFLKLTNQRSDNDIESCRNHLVKNFKNVSYLGGEFNQLVKEFKRKLKVEENMWGGPTEIKLISDYLNVAIQELIENTDDRKDDLYIKSDQTTPQNSKGKAEELEIIEILRANPKPQEVVKVRDEDAAIQLAKKNQFQLVINCNIID
jgi:hypothetical protein